METQLAQRIATDSGRGECRPDGQALSPRCADKEGISGRRISAVEDNLFALGHETRSDETEADNLEIQAALTAEKVFEAESKQLQRINRHL